MVEEDSLSQVLRLISLLSFLDVRPNDVFDGGKEPHGRIKLRIHSNNGLEQLIMIGHIINVILESDVHSDPKWLKKTRCPKFYD